MTSIFDAVEPRLPQPDGLNAEFYRRLATGHVHLQRCVACGTHQHPPRHVCRNCAGTDLDWVPVDGAGELYTWTVSHFPYDRGWAAATPYATGVVELPEGVRIVAALAPEVEPAIGLGVRLEVTRFVGAQGDADTALLSLVRADR